MGSGWWVLLSHYRLQRAKRKAAVTRPGREPLLNEHVSTIKDVGSDRLFKQLVPAFYHCCVEVRKSPG